MFYFDGWINSDFHLMRVWKSNKQILRLDLRYPICYDDNYWDGIFTEHTLEHLYPNQVLNLLKELFIILKPGAFIRIIVPDLEKYVHYYMRLQSSKDFQHWETGAEAIRSISQNFGHLSLWDKYLLKKILDQDGFINVMNVDFQKGTDRRLIKDSEVRRWESLYMEAQKPCITVY